MCVPCHFLLSLSPPLLLTHYPIREWFFTQTILSKLYVLLMKFTCSRVKSIEWEKEREKKGKMKHSLTLYVCVSELRHFRHKCLPTAQGTAGKQLHRFSQVCVHCQSTFLLSIYFHAVWNSERQQRCHMKQRWMVRENTRIWSNERQAEAAGAAVAGEQEQDEQVQMSSCTCDTIERSRMKVAKYFSFSYSRRRKEESTRWLRERCLLQPAEAMLSARFKLRSEGFLPVFFEWQKQKCKGTWREGGKERERRCK